MGEKSQNHIFQDKFNTKINSKTFPGFPSFPGLVATLLQYNYWNLAWYLNWQIYEVLGWETLTKCRWYCRLSLFFLIVNNQAPLYLRNVISPAVPHWHTNLTEIPKMFILILKKLVIFHYWNFLFLASWGLHRIWFYYEVVFYIIIFIFSYLSVSYISFFKTIDMPSPIEIIINNVTKDNTPSHLKSPCGVCNKNVLANQKVIQCGVCKIWTHMKCHVPSAESHCNLRSNNKNTRECSLCCVRSNLENIPFTWCVNNEIINI